MFCKVDKLGMASILNMGNNLPKEQTTEESEICKPLGNGTPLQCSCLENPMDAGAWWAAVHGVTKSQIWLSTFHFSYTPGTLHNKWVVVFLENLMDALPSARGTHTHTHTVVLV